MRSATRPRRSRRASSVALAAALAWTGSASAAGRLQENVTFSDYSPLSANPELVRRLLSPLAAAQIQAALARSEKRLVEQSIDLKSEKFVLYVPQEAPPHGYGLLVFVPPWQEARLPEGWGPVLDHFGMIFVSAARSGNEENVLERRAPLALLGAQNVLTHYPVDPDRVFVSGFSGGSRIAMRLALAFPDLFRGALLNAGSDALGSRGAPLPPADVFERFQQSTHLVYVTGLNDDQVLAEDAGSRRSMHEWCVFNLDSQLSMGVAHRAASGTALSGALQVLTQPLSPKASKLSECRADIDQEMKAQLGKVQALIADGRRADAQKLLIEIDRRFGGLAAPRSLELQSALD
jgi:hypothetical protein